MRNRAADRAVSDSAVARSMKKKKTSGIENYRKKKKK
jgi:hypothetical protein